MIAPMASMIASSPGAADEMTVVSPSKGNQVVMFRHRFQPGQFEEARKLVVDGFRVSKDAVGHRILTIYMVDEAANEIIAISSFLDDTDVQTYLASDARQDVLKRLLPMRSQPVHLRFMKIEDVHFAQGD
jgi:hypothetical protein